MKNIILLISLNLSLISYSQNTGVGINTDQVTDGISLEVNGNVRIATAATSTGFGNGGADFVITRDSDGIIQKRKYDYKAVIIKPRTYTTNLLVTELGPSITDQTILVASTSTFSLAEASNYTEEIKINNVKVINNNAAQVSQMVYMQMYLRNSATNALIQTQFCSVPVWTPPSSGNANGSLYFAIPNLPAGNYYYELEIKKGTSATTIQNITIDLTNLSFNSTYSFQKQIYL